MMQSNCPKTSHRTWVNSKSASMFILSHLHTVSQNNRVLLFRGISLYTTSHISSSFLRCSKLIKVQGLSDRTRSITQTGISPIVRGTRALPIIELSSFLLYFSKGFFYHFFKIKDEVSYPYANELSPSQSTYFHDL